MYKGTTSIGLSVFPAKYPEFFQLAVQKNTLVMIDSFS